MTSDIKGGRICVVPAEGDLSSLSCDRPADGMGTATTIAASIGTVYTLVKNSPLRLGTYRLLVEDSEQTPVETSQPFTVSHCADCDPNPDEAVVKAFKDAARDMEVRMAGMCQLQGALGKLAGKAIGLRGWKQDISVKVTGSVSYSTPTFALTLSGSATLFSFTIQDPASAGINKALDILKLVACGAKQMYMDMAADPPDPNFSEVTPPEPLDIGPLSPASLDSLVRSVDLERALVEATRHAFERYQGAKAAGDTAAQIMQLRAGGDEASDLSDELSRSADALRAWADVATADSELAGTILSSSDAPGLAALYQRVTDDGFTADEIQQFHSFGYTDLDVAEIRTHTSLGIDEIPLDTTYPDALRAIAAQLESRAGPVADFASEMYAIAALTDQNQTPVTADDSLIATKDSSGSVNVLANDSDPDGDTLAVTGSSDGAHGAVSCTPSGTCTYTPISGYIGPDTFTYTISDGRSGSATGTVRVTVALPNRPPSASDDQLVVDENGESEVFVLANDVDPDGEILNLLDTTPPSHGVINFGIDSFGINRIFYRPDASYVGPDSFTYTIADGRGGTATATVHITVEAVRDATNDDFNDASPVFTLPFVDREDATSATLAADDPVPSCGGGATVWYAFTATQNGPLEVDTIGSPSLSPNVAVYTGTRGSLSEIACAQSKPLVFLASAGRTYYFMVHASPSPGVLHFAVRVPTSLSLGTLSGRFFSTPLGSGAISAKPGDPVAFTQQFPVINFNPPEDSALRCSNETGVNISTLPFTDVIPLADGSCTTIPAAGNGFQAGLGDLSSFNAVFTTTIHVSGAGDVVFSFYSDDGWVLGIGSGPGGAQPTYVAGSFLNPPQRSPFEGHQIVGSFNGPSPATATALVVHFPAAGDYPAEIDYSECCSGALVLTLDTNGASTPPFTTSHAPVAVGTSATTTEDTAKALALQASDPDGDSLLYTIVSGPNHGALSGTGGDRTYTPVTNYSGPDSFTFRASDGKLDSNVATVSITVTPANDPPVASDGATTTDEDTAVPFSLQATDVDGDSLTYSIVSGPSHGGLSGTGANRIYTPSSNYHGPDSVMFKVSDGKLESNMATLAITVRPVNDPPVASDGSLTTNQNTQKAVALIASDVDGDALAYTIVGAPAHGTLTGSGATRTYTPSLGYSGPDSFTFKANDRNADSNIATVAVTVVSTNRSPVCASVDTNEKTLWPPNHKYVLISLRGGTDADGDPLTFTVAGVTQDEPTNGLGDGDTSPDATFGPSPTQVDVRAERSGLGDGRVYRIAYSLADGKGGTCTGIAKVGVPRDQAKGSVPIDSFPASYNSFLP